MRMWIVKELIKFNKLYLLLCLQRQILKAIADIDYCEKLSDQSPFMSGRRHAYKSICNTIECMITEIRKDKL